MSAYAFLGAGEFEDWHTDIDRSLLEGRSGPVLVFATASSPEGDEVYQGWIDKGLAHYAAAGIDAAAPSLRTREDANDPAIVAQVDEASTVFFSGRCSSARRPGSGSATGSPTAPSRTPAAAPGSPA
jgi:hypothetical protein